MDTLNDYGDFEQDINETFCKVIVEYKFQLSKIYDGCFELRNASCILRFTFDRGDVSCNLRPLNSSQRFGYGVYPVFRFLYPDDNTYNNGTIYNPRLQLSKYARIVTERLKIVLLGDFSWLEGFIEEEKSQNKLIEYIWNHIDTSDTIYKKFKTGDISWQSDLKFYLKEHNIKI